jgi:glutamyl-tRNA synthetase
VTVRVRIAPSPTGNLHIGTARTAVFNWLFARHHGGKFILRIEDTDVARSRPEFTDNILEGLTWLGIDWDEDIVHQSQRLDIYKEVVQTLLDKGLAYYCYTSEAELTEMREKQQARNQAPRYDNRHRNLTPEQREAFEAEGRRPVVRFKIDDNREIVWDDKVRGKITWKGNDLGGDMVIARGHPTEAFGQPLYNLAVVVDDRDMNITHIIRGEDHIANTAKQILLYEAVEANIPEFAHSPLILSPEGKKLSKRDNVTSIDEFRKLGFLPEAMANYMTLLGWTPPDSTQEIFTLPEAAKLFTLDRVSKAGAKFDWDKLDWINSQYLHAKSPTELVDLLLPFWREAGYKFDPSQRPWLEEIAGLIGASLTRLTDGVDQAKLFFDEAVTYEGDAIDLLRTEGVDQALQAVLAALEDHPELTPEDAKGLIKQVTKETKLKKGLIMRSMRAALTGALHGPDLIQSWVILHQKGWDTKRIQAALQQISS